LIHIYEYQSSRLHLFLDFLNLLVLTPLGELLFHFLLLLPLLLQQPLLLSPLLLPGLLRSQLRLLPLPPILLKLLGTRLNLGEILSKILKQGHNLLLQILPQIVFDSLTNLILFIDLHLRNNQIIQVLPINFLHHITPTDFIGFSLRTIIHIDFEIVQKVLLAFADIHLGVGLVEPHFRGCDCQVVVFQLH
jgi:hypothetical protein